MRPSLVPQCTECMRRSAFGLLREVRPALGGLQHVRGKKKSTRGPLSIPVRLLKDYDGFGATGAIVPVAIGRMRNEFFPQGIAEYVAMGEKRQLRRSQTQIERDFTFGQKIEEELVEEATPEPQSVVPKRIELKRITPERALELIEIFIPQRLDFYRQAIIETEPEPAVEASNSRAGLTDIAAELFELRAESVRQAEKEAKLKRGQAIYGSVSTLDVYEAIKASMALNEESSRVVLDEGAISFTSTDVDTEDAGKLKRTGTFDYTIKVRGADTTIKRNLKIIAQQA